jgi:hypothetical protein
MKNILDLFGLALFDGSNRTPPEHNCKGIRSAPFGFPLNDASILLLKHRQR